MLVKKSCKYASVKKKSNKDINNRVWKLKRTYSCNFCKKRKHSLENVNNHWRLSTSTEDQKKSSGDTFLFYSVVLTRVSCVSVAYDLHKIIIRVSVRVINYELCVKQNHLYSVREKKWTSFDGYKTTDWLSRYWSRIRQKAR